MAAHDLLALDPLKALMLEHGFDPATGSKLYLPESEREKIGRFVPDYVRFSPLLDEPLLINEALLLSEPRAMLGEPLRINEVLPYPIGSAHA